MLIMFSGLLCLVIIISINSFQLVRSVMNNHVCDPGQLGFHDFTGFRIQIQTVAGFRYRHVRLSFCQVGKPDLDDAYYPISGTQLPWGKKICALIRTNKNNPRCFMMARRKNLRDQQVFSPGSWVGGLFACPGTNDDDGISCNQTNAIPMQALVADNPLLTWSELPDGRHYVQRTPIFYTFVDPRLGQYDLNYDPSRWDLPPIDWFNYINVDEDYVEPDVHILLRDLGDGVARRPALPLLNGRIVDMTVESDIF